MIRDRYQNNRLAELVAKTTGLQTGRRIVHAITGTVIFVAVTQLDLSKSLTITGLSVLFLILLASDLVRLRVPHLNIIFFRFFQILVSPRESQNIASSTWYILGALIAIVLFPISAALSGILVLAWADPTASYLGRRWGKRSFLGGTLVGTTAFLVVAVLILSVRHPLTIAIPSACLITLVERLAWPLDDNLVLAPACAGILTLSDLII